MVIAQPGIEGFVVNHHLTPITQANISIVNQKDSNTLVLKTNELGFFEVTTRLKYLVLGLLHF